MDKDIDYLKQKIPAFFMNGPNKSLLLERVKEYTDLDFEYGFHYFNGNSRVEKEFVFKIRDENIYKINYTCDCLELRDLDDISMRKSIKDFNVEFFISFGTSKGEFLNPVLMGLGELSFYINTVLNEDVVYKGTFPKLHYLESNGVDDFISKGRALCRSFFPLYKGPLFNHLEFETEIKEVFAVSANSLSFLIRFENRIEHELHVIQNDNYKSGLHVFPRFNNAIAETASYIYNLWERVAFLINELAPLVNKKGEVRKYGNPPSYYKYFFEKGNQFENHPELKTDNFNWFYNRLESEHKMLSELRHPLVHYNKYGSTKGMRSAKVVEDGLRNPDYSTVYKKISNEINFLKVEMGLIDTALRKSLLLIEEWELVNNKNKI